jgi:HSP20 family molecular chaperone IbpA
MKGYIINGHFSSNQFETPFDPPNPLDPWNPIKRRPVPRRPFELLNNSIQEQREPLIDIFEEKDTIKIYMELPGEDKDDIQLNLTENQAEVKGKNFYKVIELPTQNIDMDKASSTFKNGVLQLTIPKKNITVGEDKRRIKIE